MPKLSVVLPVYNGSRYLEKALASVLSQSFSDFEVIAIDDGSSDASIEILRKYARSDERIHCISRENKGLVVTLNEGCEVARGEFLVRMDADDICASYRFERQLEYMGRNPQCVASGGRVLLIDADDDPIKPMGLHGSHEEIDSEHLAGRGGAIIHPAAIIRKDAFEKVGGYRADCAHAEDLDLFLRLAEVGELRNIPELVLYYRQHLESIGYSKRLVQSQSARRAVEDAWGRRGLGGEGMFTSPALKDDVTPAASYLKWGWWALQAGNIETAKKYAFRRIKERCVSAESWRLLFCSLRGR